MASRPLEAALDPLHGALVCPAANGNIDAQAEGRREALSVQVACESAPAQTCSTDTMHPNSKCSSGSVISQLRASCHIDCANGHVRLHYIRQLCSLRPRPFHRGEEITPLPPTTNRRTLSQRGARRTCGLLKI